MNDEQLSKMKNFNIDLEGVELIKQNIQNHFQDYDYSVDHGFYEIAYKYLKSKGKYLGIEYRFLCWLSEVFGFNIELVKPCLVVPIDMDTTEFEHKYVFNETRRLLYDNLLNIINVIKLKWNISNLSIIIGGSFSDISIVDPKDIDCVLLISSSCENFKILHENYLYSSGIITIESRIDLKVLPLNYCVNNFKAYSNIVCLGNNASVRDKMGETSMNSFERRKIIKLNF